MKQLACLLVAVCLILGILLMAVADVNHGYGPGHHVEDSSGDNTHGAEAGDHGDTAQEEPDDNGNHGEEADDHGEQAVVHGEEAVVQASGH